MIGAGCPASGRRLWIVVVLPLLAGACRVQSDTSAAQPQQVVVWRTIGSWSGHGNAQTESFTSETGTLRVRWETSPEGATGAGAFRLTAHSAISGRPLEQVVEHQGPGSGVGYVNQDPHVFYVVVESNQLNWKFSVEEGVAGQIVK